MLQYGCQKIITINLQHTHVVEATVGDLVALEVLQVIMMIKQSGISKVIEVYKV